jgi:putative transposase
MIEPDHSRLSIVRPCQLVSIARSSHYYAGKGESPLNLALMRLIDGGGGATVGGALPV